jgi:hypothetical protein
MKDEIVAKIKDIILKSYGINPYHLGTIVEDLIAYCEKLQKADKPIFWLPYDEFVKVGNWNNIRDQIKLDIIENKIEYKREEDADKSDYIKGVLAAIRLIEHRVHCICD